MNIVNEEWRDISGYEGFYQVSNLGRVRSCDRVVMRNDNSSSFIKGRLLKPSLDRKGYFRIALYKDGSRYFFLVHRLVAIAFLVIETSRNEVNHKNGVKDDNRVENLEWCTHLENMRHAIATGLTPRFVGFVGEKHPLSLLTESQVLEIRELRARGTKLRVIAEMYGVGMSVISGIVYRNNWAHLPSPEPREITPVCVVVEKREGSRFKESQVLEIRNLRERGLKLKVIAEMYGVTVSAIAGVVYRNNWKHI